MPAMGSSELPAELAPCCRWGLRSYYGSGTMHPLLTSDLRLSVMS
jgi:hypothetical protein